jgi:hypothetical protein
MDNLFIDFGGIRNEGSYELAGRKLFIALPAYDFKVSVKLTTSIAKFALMSAQYGIEIQIGSICGCSVVSRARNLLVHDFLDTDCTDLIFIDSDTVFEPEAILRLMAWTTTRGITAGAVVTRKKQQTFVTTLDTDDTGCVIMDDMGLVRAKRIGTAFMAIKRQVFLDIAKAMPEIEFWDENSQQKVKSFFDFKSTPQGYIGEDYLFCDRARAVGHEIWVDPTIRLGHLGMEEFSGCFGDDWLYPRIAPVDSKKAAA